MLIALAVDNFGSGLFLPLVVVYAVQVIGLTVGVAGTAVMIGTMVGLAGPATHWTTGRSRRPP